jgi:hypothetical protein
MIKKPCLFFLAICLAFLVAPFGVSAQETPASDSLWVVEMSDGNTYTGTITDEGGPTFRIRTSVGELTLQRAQVRRMSRMPAVQLREGQFWPENVHATRHFWGPSGYGLRAGEGYYQNTWIFLNQVSYGFTDNFTVGLGLVPLFLFGGTASPVWITPKVSLPYRNGKGAFGFGTILGGIVGRGSNDAQGIGIIYGVNTFGTRDRQITAGLGWGYGTRSGFASQPTVSLSGQWRTAKSWSFLTENYFISAGDDLFVLASAGARYMGRRIAIDFGGVIPLASEIGTLIVIPWLGITVPFE